MSNHSDPRWREIAAELVALPGAFLHIDPQRPLREKDKPIEWPVASDVVLLIEALDTSTDEYMCKRRSLQHQSCDLVLEALSDGTRNSSHAVSESDPLYYWLAGEDTARTTLNAIKDRGAMFVLDPSKTDRFTIGRGLTNTIILNDVMISNKHVTVTWTPKEVKAFIGRMLRKIQQLVPDDQNYPEQEIVAFNLIENTADLFNAQIFTNTDSSLNGTFITFHTGESKKLPRDHASKFSLKDTFSAGIPTVKNGVHSFIAQFSITIISRDSAIIQFLKLMNDLKGCPVKMEPKSSTSPLLKRSLHDNSVNARRRTTVHSKLQSPSPAPRTVVEPYPSNGLSRSPLPNSAMNKPSPASVIEDPSSSTYCTPGGVIRSRPSSNHHSRDVVRMRNQITRDEKELERLNAELRRQISAFDSMEAECQTWQARAAEAETVVPELEELKLVAENSRKEVSSLQASKLQLQSELDIQQESIDVVTRERDRTRAEVTQLRKECAQNKQDLDEMSLKLNQVDAARQVQVTTNNQLVEEIRRLREILNDLEDSLNAVSSSFINDLNSLLQQSHTKTRLNRTSLTQGNYSSHTAPMGNHDDEAPIDEEDSQDTVITSDHEEPPDQWTHPEEDDPMNAEPNDSFIPDPNSLVSTPRQPMHRSGPQMSESLTPLLQPHNEDARMEVEAEELPRTPQQPTEDGADEPLHGNESRQSGVLITSADSGSDEERRSSFLNERDLMEIEESTQID